MPEDAKPLSISGWLMRGAIREDDVPPWVPGSINPPDDPYYAYTLIRVLNHFYDPALDRPLTVGIGLGAKAPDWATGSSNAFTSPNTPDASRRNHFTIFDAREAMYRALTGRDSQGNVVGRDAQGNPVPATEADRNKYWATTFRALGDTVHLLQDMGQPQHTRNDPHAGGKYDGSAGVLGHKSVFENYLDARATGTKFKTTGATPIDVSAPALTYTGYPIPAFTNYVAYFTTRNKDAGIYDRKGLADYSNRGFFTAGKNMGNTDYAYPLNTPNTYLLEKVYTDWQGNPLPNGSYVTLLKDVVSDTVNPALGGGAKPLTSYGLFDQFLVAPKLPSYTLNRYNYDAMADLLIPRSVAYSAGLINFFFRGKIDFVLDQNSGAYIIKNLSSEAMTGTFTLYYDDMNGARQPVPGATWNLTIAANSQYGFVSFATPTSPAPRMPGDYMLVFNGDMGEEKATPGVTVGAVAAKKIKEATHAIVGQAYDGWESRAFYYTETAGFFPIPHLSDGHLSYAYGVSNDGKKVAGYTATSTYSFAWIWDAQNQTQPIGKLPNGTYSIAYGISGDGKIIIGIADDNYIPVAFRWSAATGMVSIGGLPGAWTSYAYAASFDGSVITGTSYVGYNQHAFRWTAATGMVDLGTLPGGTDCGGFGVSKDGTIIVGYCDTISGRRAFRWTAETGMVNLGSLPGGGNVAAWAISADGLTIVGSASTSTGSHAFKWTQAGGMQDLGSLGVNQTSQANGVSPDGKIITGWSNSANGQRAFRWTQETGMLSIGTFPGFTASYAQSNS